MSRIFVVEAVMTCVMRRKSEQVGGSRAVEKAIGNHVIATVRALGVADVASRLWSSRFVIVDRPFAHS